MLVPVQSKLGGKHEEEQGAYCQHRLSRAKDPTRRVRQGWASESVRAHAERSARDEGRSVRKEGGRVMEIWLTSTIQCTLFGVFPSCFPSGRAHHGVNEGWGVLAYPRGLHLLAHGCHAIQQGLLALLEHLGTR